MGGCAAKLSRRFYDDKIDYKGGNVYVIATEAECQKKMEEAKTIGKTVVINFSAAWCGPCRVIAPLYVELSKTYPQLMFLALDTEDLPQEFSKSWELRATPTFFFLKDGQRIDKLVGANKPELEKKCLAAANASQYQADANASH